MDYDELQRYINDLQQSGYTWSWQANTSLDLGGLWNTIKQGLGVVTDVIAVVGPLLA